MLVHLDISSEVLFVQNQPVKLVFQRCDSLDYRSVLWEGKGGKKNLIEWSFQKQMKHPACMSEWTTDWVGLRVLRCCNNYILMCCKKRNRLQTNETSRKYLTWLLSWWIIQLSPVAPVQGFSLQFAVGRFPPSCPRKCHDSTVIELKFSGTFRWIWSRRTVAGWISLLLHTCAEGIRKLWFGRRSGSGCKRFPCGKQDPAIWSNVWQWTTQKRVFLNFYQLELDESIWKNILKDISNITITLRCFPI